ncbi:plasmid pRiA4b ORF-3 family protein [Lacicoccus alkaliphilus]|uniref:PRiA4b ORF-3-like protein n=1 Tax=Lacicoccus alkaliphilus DSM 16010 TaxID=1123231 RepID=A0A1M7HXB9_9BACL|nr:plasmid pRiA4b ORF-3 family protein [Salinicoccus alkaliphilus]SHM32983.1 pRiA4b ORF-3-like protein [Salinicoccus alkaliphilus DSM 16010]
MGIQEFYRKFVTEDILNQLNEKRKKGDQSIDEFVVYRYREMTNPYHISWLVEQLSTQDLSLIEQLKASQSEDGYYTVEASGEEHPFLVDQFILVPYEGNQYVVHEGTLRSLVKEMNKNDKNLKWLNEISPLKRAILISYADLDLEDLLRGITITQLKEISKALSHTPASLQKEVFVDELKRLLTDSRRIKRILLSLPDESFQVIKERAENDHPFYNDIGEFKELIASGLVIRLEGEYGITHPKVLETIRETNLGEVEEQRYKNVLLKNKQRHTSYNAFKIKISLPGGENKIYREMIIPTRLNFYELHLVIQSVFDWNNVHSAQFIYDKLVIRVFSDDQGDDGREKPELTSSHIQVDALLTEGGSLGYVYDYKTKWFHKIELVEFLSEEERPCPEIVGYTGPCPIEESKGIEDFDRLYMILNDKTHPEYLETEAVAKRSNYKTRFPKSAINRKLQKIFAVQYAITEFNDKNVKVREN